MIRIGSLFAGIGGLELGLSWAFAEAGIPHRVEWQVECEPFPRAVLAKHWPNTDRSVTDVCTASSANLAPVDLICGGFPCQDLSYAGKGAGIADGTRSGLWFEYRRLVRDLQPRLVVVENVGALLARGAGTVLGDLAALRYDAEWHCIRASDIGAPHQRERLFIVAVSRREQYGDAEKHVPRSPCAADASCGGSSLGHADALREPQPQGKQSDERGRTGDDGGHVADSDRERQRPGTRCTEPERVSVSIGSDEALAHAASQGRSRAEQWQSERERARSVDGSGSEGPEPESRMGGTSHGLPARVDGCGAGPESPERWPSGPGETQHIWEAPRTAAKVRYRSHRLKALGNAVVPQVAREVGRWMIARDLFAPR